MSSLTMALTQRLHLLLLIQILSITFNLLNSNLVTVSAYNPYCSASWLQMLQPKPWQDWANCNFEKSNTNSYDMTIPGSAERMSIDCWCQLDTTPKWNDLFKDLVVNGLDTSTTTDCCLHPSWSNICAVGCDPGDCNDAKAQSCKTKCPAMCFETDYQHMTTVCECQDCWDKMRCVLDEYKNMTIRGEHQRICDDSALEMSQASRDWASCVARYPHGTRWEQSSASNYCVCESGLQQELEKNHCCENSVVYNHVCSDTLTCPTNPVDFCQTTEALNCLVKCRTICDDIKDASAECNSECLQRADSSTNPPITEAACFKYQVCKPADTAIHAYICDEPEVLPDLGGCCPRKDGFITSLPGNKWCPRFCSETDSSVFYLRNPQRHECSCEGCPKDMTELNNEWKKRISQAVLLEYNSGVSRVIGTMSHKGQLINQTLVVTAFANWRAEISLQVPYSFYDYPGPPWSSQIQLEHQKHQAAVELSAIESFKRSFWIDYIPNSNVDRVGTIPFAGEDGGYQGMEESDSNYQKTNPRLPSLSGVWSVTNDRDWYSSLGMENGPPSGIMTVDPGAADYIDPNSYLNPQNVDSGVDSGSDSGNNGNSGNNNRNSDAGGTGGTVGSNSDVGQEFLNEHNLLVTSDFETDDSSSSSSSAASNALVWTLVFLIIFMLLSGVAAICMYRSYKNQGEKLQQDVTRTLARMEREQELTAQANHLNLQAQSGRDGSGTRTMVTVVGQPVLEGGQNNNNNMNNNNNPQMQQFAAANAAAANANASTGTVVQDLGKLWNRDPNSGTFVNDLPPGVAMSGPSTGGPSRVRNDTRRIGSSDLSNQNFNGNSNNSNDNSPTNNNLNSNGPNSNGVGGPGESTTTSTSETRINIMSNPGPPTTLPGGQPRPVNPNAVITAWADNSGPGAATNSSTVPSGPCDTSRNLTNSGSGGGFMNMMFRTGGNTNSNTGINLNDNSNRYISDTDETTVANTTTTPFSQQAQGSIRDIPRPHE